MKILFYLTLILNNLILQNINAQEHFVNAAASSAIDQQLDSHFGVDYEIADYIFVDSLEEHYDIDRELIDDEYGTLDNCIVFTAEKTQTYKNVKGIVGVYKNGQIIWYSDYIIPDNEIYGNGFIYSIEDINNDGKVEIMTEWEGTGGASYNTIRLFVHEWDGNQGVLVGEANCYETQLFKYIDIQGDGIFGSTARAELEKVLTDCNTDSSTVLTSEAYALLYFNTEYLVNKLPKTQTNNAYQ